MSSEWSKSGVREVCEDIASGAIDNAMEKMKDMCGNAGQAAIIDNSDCTGAFSDISNGEYGGGGIDCNHPDAVTSILQTGDDILKDASDRCATIREAARGHDGDRS